MYLKLSSTVPSFARLVVSSSPKSVKKSLNLLSLNDAVQVLSVWSRLIVTVTSCASSPIFALFVYPFVQLIPYK